MSTIQSHLSGVSETLDRYAGAARAGRSALLRDHLLTDARVRGLLDGVALDRSAAEFLSFIDASGPTPALVTTVIWFDIAGEVALVRLDCRRWHGVDYTDLLSLIRRDGDWRIASKLFHAHPPH